MSRSSGALLCLTACFDYGFRDPRQVTDEWVVHGDVDIVVVGDTSDSMTDTLVTFTENLTRFVTRLEQAEADWHLVAITGPDGCGQGGVLSAAVPGWEAAFTTGILTKPREDLVDEWGLYNGAQALARSAEGECNEGFLRDDAYLHVVFISDEDDNSPGYDGTDPEYWRIYVDAYLAAKRFDSDRVHLTAVGGPEPNGCSFADFARGYWEAVDATAGDFLSICDDWVTELDALANRSVSRDTFRLESNPYADSIHVFVDGLERIDGWVYRAREGAVVFTSDPPFVGQVVAVRYAEDPGGLD